MVEEHKGLTFSLVPVVKVQSLHIHSRVYRGTDTQIILLNYCCIFGKKTSAIPFAFDNKKQTNPYLMFKHNKG